MGLVGVGRELAQGRELTQSSYTVALSHRPLRCGVAPPEKRELGHKARADCALTHSK